MSNEFTYTLKGSRAAAAKMMAEVYEIFDNVKASAEPSDDWRLELYIMQVMTADFAQSWEWPRDKILDVVKAACHGYERPKAEADTAFRRLARRGFLYGSYTQAFGNEKRKRSYGLKLSRYDTEKAAS